jgi:hypothetical protein
MEIRTILVPTDFSTHAAGPGGIALPANFYDEFRKAAKANLDELLQRVAASRPTARSCRRRRPSPSSTPRSSSQRISWSWAPGGVRVSPTSCSAAWQSGPFAWRRVRC